MQFIAMLLSVTVTRGPRDAIAGGLEQRKRDYGATTASRIGDLRPNTGHAGCSPEAGARRWRKSLGAYFWRKWHGKRHCRPAAAPLFPLGQWSVRQSKLPGYPWYSAGERTVRL